MKSVLRCCILLVTLTLAMSAWAQWSSDPSQNLALSNISGADQVQPKVLPLPNDDWYVSWFNNNPNDPPPNFHQTTAIPQTKYKFAGISARSH